ncbi:26S protease regulatory subunit 4 [Fukomys damarensis]|uniref:26S protease regulatory subunit 4 n=1 Tax=Fukomys damarensis TaxID=885580 RepID=A0A091CSI7_FUKDA|nr:26S protease regulatory subunit 4 [Fukomys damarensis]
MDDTDPLVTVMKVEKAPQEAYADIGGLNNQIQEIKESVELPSPILNTMERGTPRCPKDPVNKVRKTSKKGQSYAEVRKQQSKEVRRKDDGERDKRGRE